MCLILLISPRSHGPVVTAVACRAGRPRFSPSTFQKFFSCLVVVKKLTTSWSKIVGCQIENNKLTLAVLPEGKLKLKNAGISANDVVTQFPKRCN